MRLVADDGRRFTFDGRQVPARPRRARRLERHHHAVRHAHRRGRGQVVAAGVLRLGAGDFARQLTTMRVTGVGGRRRRPCGWPGSPPASCARCRPSTAARSTTSAGSPTRPARRSRSPATGRRRLACPRPSPAGATAPAAGTRAPTCGDDAWLRLTRYEGGRRGPVLLAPGFGMSATSFLVDTVDTNLVEHLSARATTSGCSTTGPASTCRRRRTPFTLDDVARADWPAAVAEVLPGHRRRAACRRRPLRRLARR